jgi:hypothetical protein
MAANVVKVRFSRSSTPKFNFDPLDKVAHPHTTVQWTTTKTNPNDPDFNLEAVTFYRGPHPFRNTRVDKSTNVIHTDVHDIAAPHHYSVVVSVTDATGTQYYSSTKEYPDSNGPTIRNK